MHLRDPTSWQQPNHQRMQTTLSHFRHVGIIGAPRNLRRRMIWTHLPEPPPDLRSGRFEKAFLLPHVLHLFSLAEKLRTLGESLPEMLPTLFVHSQCAQSTTMCFTEVWDGFSFSSHPFWAFTPSDSIMFSCSSLTASLRITLFPDFKKLVWVWNMSVDVDLGSAPAVFLDPGICAKACGFGCFSEDLN